MSNSLRGLRERLLRSLPQKTFALEPRSLGAQQCPLSFKAGLSLVVRSLRRACLAPSRYGMLQAWSSDEQLIGSKELDRRGIYLTCLTARVYRDPRENSCCDLPT